MSKNDSFNDRFFAWRKTRKGRPIKNNHVHSSFYVFDWSLSVLKLSCRQSILLKHYKKNHYNLISITQHKKHAVFSQTRCSSPWSGGHG